MARFNFLAIKNKVLRAIRAMPDEIDIFRTVYNEFNEPKDLRFVTCVCGYFYKSSYFRGKASFVNLIIKDLGKIYEDNGAKLLVVIDAESSKVCVGDIVSFKGESFEITDLGKSFDVYYDFSLEKV